jgi:glycosyltransferase involved in cell wall biosynthesis
MGAQYRNRVVTIYNGIEVSRFATDQPAVVGEKIIIGTVGRQTILKNQIQILQAIRSISGTVPIHFFLIGDKSKESYIDNQRFVIDNGLGGLVTILDSQVEVELFYRRFNVFVLSSINESCPNALLEAMLSRCLCVVSEGANSDHFITDGINGLVYNGTQRMLADKLLEAIAIIRNNEHHRMADKGVEYVIRNFSFDSMVMAYSDIYQNMLSGTAYSE